MIVYRKEGCSSYIPAPCEVGLVASLGFTEIGRISIKDTLFLDAKAENNKIYSYALVANLPVSGFVSLLSVPSNLVCIGSELPQIAPVITRVSVQTTDAQTGSIFLGWTRPLGFDSTKYKGLYQYKLYRATGINGGAFQLIRSIQTRVDKTTADTTFVDSGLNTLQNGYTYKIVFLYENDKILAESQAASSVRLITNAEAQKIRISWQANVPWSNDNRRHRIYRESRTNPSSFNVIAEVSVGTANTYTYTDDGVDRFPDDGVSTIQMKVDTSYCYKVETIGTYARLPLLGLLNNFSQVICESPVDNTPPCPPILSSEEIDCQNLDRKAICQTDNLTNKFSWSTPPATGGLTCKVDILKYNIYYARYKDQQPKLLASIPPTETSFTHTKSLQEGFAGCYYLTATNRLNNESLPSNTVCKDNCPIVELPNVITPNGDGKNDTFSPMSCSAFIKTIDIEIYNRYGMKVYESNGNILSWDGKTSNGTELSSGTYFYIARVILQRLDKVDEVAIPIKGWVEIIK
jgi:gliding motility-associated-like protein